ncbi:general stress protein [Varibaculum prostatecancerukia]|uniref:general stress protein n=1 Tax=Varibaculum prostatecancerukia TaxID=2811781 RepID=UPI001C005DB9|nr:general stress protein [Varibaculum prostatecancerukia]
MALFQNHPETAAPSGQDLATFPSRESAEEAINYLQSKDFPVRQLLVQERGLTRSNQVVGVVTWPKALLSGFTRGLMMGLFLALLFVLWKPAWAVFAPLIIGAFAIFRAIERLVAWAIRSSSAGYPIAFSSSLTAEKHVLMTSEDYYTARRLLLDDSRFQSAVVEQDAPSNVTSGPTEFGSGSDEQPRYGVRLTPDARRQLRAQQEQLKGQAPAASAPNLPPAVSQTPEKKQENSPGREENGEVSEETSPNSDLNDAR